MWRRRCASSRPSSTLPHRRAVVAAGRHGQRGDGHTGGRPRKLDVELLNEPDVNMLFVRIRRRHDASSDAGLLFYEWAGPRALRHELPDHRGRRPGSAGADARALARRSSRPPRRRRPGARRHRGHPPWAVPRADVVASPVPTPAPSPPPSGPGSGVPGQRHRRRRRRRPLAGLGGTPGRHLLTMELDLRSGPLPARPSRSRSARWRSPGPPTTAPSSAGRTHPGIPTTSRAMSTLGRRPHRRRVAAGRSCRSVAPGRLLRCP